MNTTKRSYKKEPIKVRLTKMIDGKFSISLETYCNGKRTYERLHDLFILPETDEKGIKKNKATDNKVEKIRKQRLKELKQQLKELPVKGCAIHQELSEQRMLLTEWLDRYYEIQKSRGVRDLKAITRLKRFINGYDGSIALEDMDKEYCLGFVEYLRSGYINKNGKNLSSKSAFNIFGELRTALNTAVRDNVIGVNPVNQLSATDKIQPKETIREYLTIEEVKKLIATPCKSLLVKQAYLFSCNCGLRLSDVQALRWKDISYADGAWRVSTRMLKTERVIYIPLPKQAQKWLPKRGQKKADDIVFENLTADKLKTNLKPWVKEAGIINKNVTYHTARHTYATMLLTLGADIYTVSKLLGHTSIRHTQRYAKIINKKKDDAIALIDNIP